MKKRLHPRKRLIHLPARVRVVAAHMIIPERGFAIKRLEDSFRIGTLWSPPRGDNQFDRRITGMDGFIKRKETVDIMIGGLSIVAFKKYFFIPDLYVSGLIRLRV